MAAGLLLGTLASLGICELVLRIHNPFASHLRGGRIDLPTHRRYRIENLQLPGVDPVVSHTHNSLGFRGPEPPADLRACTSLVTVGGSTTECFYLSDDRTWSALLARHLAERIPDVWLNNAGLDGHSTFGHRVLLEQAILPLRPRYVLFLTGVNDLGRDSLTDADRYFLDRASHGVIQALALHSEVLTLVINIIRASAARDAAVEHRALDLTTAPRLPPLAEGEAARRHGAWVKASLPRLDAFRDRVRDLCRACRGAAIEPILITQPLLFGDVTDPVTGLALGDLDLGDDTASGSRLTSELYWRRLERYNDVLRQLGPEERVPVIDLARAMPKSSSYFYDSIHFNNAGAGKVAEIVHSGLLPLLAAGARTTP